jgi:hypothetical protein
MVHESNSAQVVVIGAGIAGLTAAALGTRIRRCRGRAPPRFTAGQMLTSLLSTARERLGLMRFFGSLAGAKPAKLRDVSSGLAGGQGQASTDATVRPGDLADNASRSGSRMSQPSSLERPVQQH